ncbi:MAG: hypothetical protein OEW19_11565, partial [Acidobacteriota bacterium]|nr:hypothetical protein [Acidobacteriota bacterium]
DNLKVTLRAPLTLRSVPSLAIPVLVLLALLVVAFAGMGLLGGGPPMVVAGLGTLIVLAIPHTVLLISRTPPVGRSSVHAARALLFSATYNLARSLALVFRAAHGTRRSG